MARIESLTDDPAVVLYLVALTDVRALAAAPYNIGLLYLAADVAQVEGCDGLTAARDELAATSARLTEAITSPDVLGALGPARLGEKLVHTVDEVVGRRNAGRRIGVDEAVWIASSCLRLCGVDSARVELVVKTAATLLDQADAGADPAG